MPKGQKQSENWFRVAMRSRRVSSVVRSGLRESSECPFFYSSERIAAAQWGISIEITAPSGDEPIHVELLRRKCPGHPRARSSPGLRVIHISNSISFLVENRLTTPSSITLRRSRVMPPRSIVVAASDDTAAKPTVGDRSNNHIMSLAAALQLFLEASPSRVPGDPRWPALTGGSSSDSPSASSRARQR